MVEGKKRKKKNIYKPNERFWDEKKLKYSNSGGIEKN